MTKLIPALALTLALSGALAIGPARAADEMQVAGTSVLSNVEQHLIMSGVNPKGMFMIEKLVE